MSLGKYGKLILGGGALAILALKMVAGISIAPLFGLPEVTDVVSAVPVADKVFEVVVAVLGAFGVYRASNR